MTPTERIAMSKGQKSNKENKKPKVNKNRVKPGKVWENPRATDSEKRRDGQKT
jgi:hypothetical protein